MQKPAFDEIAKKFSLKPLPESEVELSGEVPYDAVLPYREQALKHIVEHIEMPGFRPGKVPPEMALKKVGEGAMLEEAVELFIKDFYPALIETHKVGAVGRPDIRITKLAPDNPVAFVIKAATYPEVTLPKNWKSFGEKIVLEATLPATDEEVDKTIESIRQARRDPNTKDGPLPELNDEFAKNLGAFESVAALKDQIKKGIGEEKEHKAKDERRGKIIDALLEKVEVAIPRIFIESELEKILSQMREDVTRFGVTFDEYLKQINKTEDTLREEFREQAKKRAKLQLTLNKIADVEQVKADEADIEREMKHALEHFPDANPELVRVHIETVLRNEKTLQLLEGENK